MDRLEREADDQQDDDRDCGLGPALGQDLAEQMVGPVAVTPAGQGFAHRCAEGIGRNESRARPGATTARAPLRRSYFFRSLEIPAGPSAVGVVFGDRDQRRVVRALDRAGFTPDDSSHLIGAGHLRRLRRHVVAHVEIERARLHQLAGALALAAARGRDEHLAGEAGFLDRGRGADVHAVPEADDAAEIGVLLQHRLRDRLGLGGVPVGRLARDDLDLRVLGEHVLDALQRVGAGGGRQRALDDRDLVRLALAGLDDRLRYPSRRSRSSWRRRSAELR